MGGRRKSGGVGCALVLLLLVGLAGGYGQELLILAGVVGVVWLGYKFLVSRPEGLSGQATPRPPPTFSSGGDTQGVYIRLGTSPASRTDLKKDPRRFWVDDGKNVSVQGRSIGGMIYVGEGLASLGAHSVEPALIDPSLPVVRQKLELSERRTSYWPSYSTSSPEARAAYLQWLSSGRKDPVADIGLVFLYFYGLERRALADPLMVEVPGTEIEAIRAEVQRLLGIYNSGSFQHYARGFLDVLDVKGLPSALYLKPPPSSSHLEMRHKVGLAQCAQDGAPLPVDWAIAWLENDASGRLPAAAIRCKSEFRRLFAIRYTEAYGGGLVLPKNKTKLRIDYHAASGSFHGWERSLVFAFDVPDVSVLASPVKKLRAIAEGCCEELTSYSRRRAKAGADPDSLECIAELPYALWPEKYRGAVEKIRAMVTASGQPLAVPFETVQEWMPNHAALGKPQWRGFVGRLAEAGLGVEPDPAAGGPVPTADTRVAFFSLGTERRAEETSARYRAAAMTLQLAVAVASADGATQDLDRSALIGRLEEWLHLAATEKARLNAHLRRLLAQDPKITGLKRQAGSMNKAMREAVGTFVVSIAHADGTITKPERKVLERIFKLLELDPTRLPPMTPEEPRVVVAAGESPIVHPIRQATRAFSLDRARVREAQAETERVAALLTGIFSAEEETSAPASQPSNEAVEDEAPVLGLWGLDPEHSDLARKLLARAHWTRSELEELAEDRQIMLDGVLETINEACLDATGQQLLEGSDPVEVNRDLAREEQVA